MKDYNAQNNKFIKNGLVIIERMLTEIERLKIDRITDVILLRFLTYFISEIEKLKIIISSNPRFEWFFLQEEIDRLYSMDKNLTGINIQLNWKDGENRAFLIYNIKPRS
ncbi:hypothetical protein LPB136_13485 [Tenacibaculum todarodis]|uniref:Uncharacterized protein n=1 Tax=Tenacibaculum todarodis TaxID=1850252 RepID=A0A1L3JMK6_9FLAO|nr:hypothetical protein [Tenacibaculum todarodis]APG66322.1 hypothetical protein LPB136_13485 [Tenacibaculum todarodis]